MKRRNHLRTYKSAGVNITAGEEVVARIRKKVGSTFSAQVLSELGGFGAFFGASFREYKQPVLVSSVDGVGTKLKIAFLLNKHDTIGQDLVNHCVNDIAVCGAKPLFFLDYFATGRLRPQVAEQVISGFVKACKENRCALVGGETAEMPGFYPDGEYDVSGTIVGVVEKSKTVDGKKVRRGDVLIGLSSTGLHTNGYSLARAVLLKKFRVDQYVDEFRMTLGEELMKIHRSYLKPISAIMRKFEVRGMSHITGGGIVGNTMRVVPKHLKLKIDWNAWQRPTIFQLIQKLGKVPEKEMRRTFNLGVGIIFIMNKKLGDKIIELLRLQKEKPFFMGEIA